MNKLQFNEKEELCMITKYNDIPAFRLLSQMSEKHVEHDWK